MHARTTRGQAAITSVVFFLFISLSVMLGLSGSAIREVRIVSDTVKSKQGFFTAESGSEDYTYRLRTGRQTSSSETLALNGATTTITLIDIGSGQKEILSSAELEGFIRKVKSVLTIMTGTSFNYGMQAGTGGIEFSNNAGIVGNVYSNGDITGGSGSYITGTAIAANSVALSTEQANDTPSTPSAEVVFGNASGTQDFAQSFVMSTTSPVNRVELYLKRTSSSPGNLTVRIVPDDGGAPDGSTIVSATLSASLVTTSFGWVSVTFSSNPDLLLGETYWLVLDGSNSSSKYYTVGANTAYESGIGKLGQYEGSWNNTSPSGQDGYFRLYVGGLTGTIDGVEIGEDGVGNAWAHTVTDSTIAGTNYCQTGSGNNKPCDTSQPDPLPQDFPISEGNVAAWKSDAAAGGTHSGDYTLNGNSGSLGPKRITGDLNITNGATLTVNGTLWIEGDVTFSNGSSIRLASSYGSLSGIIIVDGKVTISNNAQFYGSGQSSSYLLVLSTSACPNAANCDGENAIEVANNAGTAILYAMNGTLHLSNNAGAKEATGRHIKLDNGATITYESGLANVNFSSGPGGSFYINTWREVK